MSHSHEIPVGDRTPRRLYFRIELPVLPPAPLLAALSGPLGSASPCSFLVTTHSVPKVFVLDTSSRSATKTSKPLLSGGNDPVTVTVIDGRHDRYRRQKSPEGKWIESPVPQPLPPHMPKESRPLVPRLTEGYGPTGSAGGLLDPPAPSSWSRWSPHKRSASRARPSTLSRSSSSSLGSFA